MSIRTAELYDPRREESRALAESYSKLVHRIMSGEVVTDWPSIPWQDERFRKMFAQAAGNATSDALKWRNATRALNAFIQASR